MTSYFSAPSRPLWLRGMLGSYFVPDHLRRRSARNRLKDYGALLSRPDAELWKLHARLEQLRDEERRDYRSYDYGNGYYYQSMRRIGISGYRDTDERIRQLSLSDRLSGKRVLDIGSNAGFLLLSMAQSIGSGLGVEFNPYLVKTANAVRDYLGADNVHFLATSFENFKSPEGGFDVILSLANHSTFDGNTRHTVVQYFEKIRSLLAPGGRLVFESHPPQIEPEAKLRETLSVIENLFSIEEQPKVALTNLFDKDRTYVIAAKSS